MAFMRWTLLRVRSSNSEIRQDLLKKAHLNAFLVQCILVEVEDGGLDGAGGR